MPECDDDDTDVHMYVRTATQINHFVLIFLECFKIWTQNMIPQIVYELYKNKIPKPVAQCGVLIKTKIDD